MAMSEARRQKQLAKKKARRAEKRTTISLQNSDNPLIRLADAAKWPIVEACVPDDLWEIGAGNLMICRRHPSGRMAFAVFLMDTFCLGVKKCVWNILPESEYYAIKQDFATLKVASEVAPEYFAKVVLEAVDYAQSFGFPPHAEFRYARMLLQGIDPSFCLDKFTFGLDGRPFYSNTAEDSPEKIKTILHRLEQVGGLYRLYSPEDFEKDDFEPTDRSGEWGEPRKGEW